MPDHRILAALLVAASLAAAVPASGAPLELPSFKDDLFAYPTGTTRSDDGARTDVAYSEVRDINGRDEIPERRVRMTYVDPAPLRHQVEVVVDTPAGKLKTMQVGEQGQAKAIVLFIHGRNGDRRLGMYDRTFGGNFNRLKNLLDRSGGLYATADAGNFGSANETKIASLIGTLKARAPRAPLVLACASMGGEFCWDLVGERSVAAKVSGVVMLSANNVPAKVGIVRRNAGAHPIPLVLTHGTRDKVFAWEKTAALYSDLHAAGYPVRLVSMNDGNHGTPLRMIDWRETLNWIFARSSS